MIVSEKRSESHLYPSSDHHIEKLTAKVNDSYEQVGQVVLVMYCITVAQLLQKFPDTLPDDHYDGLWIFHRRRNSRGRWSRGLSCHDARPSFITGRRKRLLLHDSMLR